MLKTAGQTVIKFASTSQNSGMAMNKCDDPKEILLIVKALYYRISTTIVSSCSADATTKLNSYCDHSNNCYLQASNQLCPSS